MKILTETEKGLVLEVPAYRVDVQRPCDVVEDILRVYGYNNVEIPTQLKSSLVIKGEEDKKHKLENIIGEQLVGCGFNEILNNSLTKAAYYENLNHYHQDNLVRIMNPLSSDLNVMRETLLYGGLESLEHNIKRKNPNLYFFEFGNVYFFNKEKHTTENPQSGYSEEYHLGLWITGQRVSGSWAHVNEDTSFYELKAYVMNILRRIGLPIGAVVFKKSDNDIFSTAMSIENRGGKTLVEMGIVCRKHLKSFGIEAPVYYAELNLALLVDKSVEFAEIEKVAYMSEKKLLKKVELFDVYEGKNLPEGKKSYAVNFILQDEEKTLTEKHIEAVMTKIIANMKKQIGAELR